MTALLEAELIVLSDDELVSYIANLFENSKRLAEAAKNDETLKEMREAAKLYMHEHYGQEIKILTIKLKAARDQAKVRDIAFKLPEYLK